MMGYGGFGAMAGWDWPGMLLGLVVWIGLIVLLVWGASALFAPRAGSGEGTPLEILRRRYARGEISEAEYEQARRTLA